jgi:hypothetical protein
LDQLRLLVVVIVPILVVVPTVVGPIEFDGR